MCHARTARNIRRTSNYGDIFGTSIRLIILKKKNGWLLATPFSTEMLYTKTEQIRSTPQTGLRLNVHTSGCVFVHFKSFGEFEDGEVGREWVQQRLL